MIIVLLTPHFPPATDGVGDYTFCLAQALNHEGHEIHVICGTQMKTIDSGNIKVHAIMNDWKPADDKALLQRIEIIQPDWVGLQYVPYSFHRFGAPLHLPGLLRKIKTSGVRVWITFHEVRIRVKGIKSFIVSHLQRITALRMSAEADQIVTSIPFYAQLLGKWHQSTFIIPVGSNIPAIRMTQSERHRLREEIFPDATFVLSTFGIRNLQYLLQAVALLRQQIPGIRLLVCGKTQIESKPDDSWVQFSGIQPAASIAQMLQISDLFVMPDYVSAEAEGGTCNKSGSLAAAYANHLPVIGTRGDMTGSLLKHGENIWLTDGQNAESLAAAILKLWSDETLREQICKGGQHLYENHLNWEMIALQYLNMMQQPS